MQGHLEIQDKLQRISLHVALSQCGSLHKPWHVPLERVHSQHQAILSGADLTCLKVPYAQRPT